MTTSRQSWAVVVPVKRLDVAKTRLDVAPATRVDLALAMATDTVRACLSATAVSVVVVVTDDDRAAAAVRELGARVVADEPDAGLNPALEHGAAAATETAAGTRIASVSSDLPALTGAVLDEVLAIASATARACVADAAGTGTTLLAARDLAAFTPQFGADSLRRHLAAGAVDLSGRADPRLRRDVDTVGDLADAMQLGCGPSTTALASAALS